MKLRHLLLGRKAMTDLDSILKSRDITLTTKVCLVKAMVWCFWTVVLEKTLESPLVCKIQPVNPKGNQSWVFIGRTDAKAEIPILWPPGAKNWLIWKDPDAGKDWEQEEKGTTGWDGWMASLTQWTWVWVDSGSWWWTVGPGVLPFMGSQRVGHNRLTELNWTENYSWGGSLSESSEELLCWRMASSAALHLIQTKLTHQHNRMYSFKVSKETDLVHSEYLVRQQDSGV